MGLDQPDEGALAQGPGQTEGACPLERPHRGSFALDYDALDRVEPGASEQRSGRIAVEYDLTGKDQPVAILMSGDSDDTGYGYGYAENADGSGELLVSRSRASSPRAASTSSSRSSGPSGVPTTRAAPTC